MAGYPRTSHACFFYLYDIHFIYDYSEIKEAILHLFRFMLKRMEHFIMHNNKFFYGGYVGISEIK
jgi:glutaredoxin-related protein